MVRQYFNEHKLLIIATLGGIFIVCFAFSLWILFKPGDVPAAAIPEPIRLEYCGAELETLCILSFGRDGDGNSIINLFVPKRKFPAFYLKVSRVTGESISKCNSYEEIPTTVYCVGEPINLDERIEISILSKADDALLATGRFTMTAVLIAADEAVTSQPSATEPKSISGTKTRTPTPTPRTSGTPKDLTPSPTVSYPNSPNYP